MKIEEAVQKEMAVRHACMKDLEELASLEAECFPPSQACPKEQMAHRLAAYPDHFWIHEENGKIVSFVDGMVCTQADLSDEMYENTLLHERNGKWLMILGVDTDPAFRNRHFALGCLEAMLRQAQEEQLYGIVLACRSRLIPFYEKCGFRDEGISGSTHGNEIWHQMRRILPPAFIETRHLVLRAPQPDDAENLYAHLLKYEDRSRQVCHSVEESRKWLADYIAASSEPNAVLLISDEKNGEQAAGFAGFCYHGMRLFEEKETALGPAFPQEYEGEILDAFLEWSFAKCGGTSFSCSCRKDDMRFIRLAASRGFHLKESNARQFQKDGMDCPHPVYEISRDEYKK